METYHLVPSKGGWQLEKEGDARRIKFFATKREGIEFSTTHVRKNTGSLKIHKENGQFEEERTYPRGMDPSSSKG
jgi:hypothetical protein